MFSLFFSPPWKGGEIEHPNSPCPTSHRTCHTHPRPHARQRPRRHGGGSVGAESSGDKSEIRSLTASWRQVSCRDAPGEGNGNETLAERRARLSGRYAMPMAHAPNAHRMPPAPRRKSGPSQEPARAMHLHCPTPDAPRQDAPTASFPHFREAAPARHPIQQPPFLPSLQVQTRHATRLKGQGWVATEASMAQGDAVRRLQAMSDPQPTFTPNFVTTRQRASNRRTLDRRG